MLSNAGSVAAFALKPRLLEGKLRLLTAGFSVCVCNDADNSALP